MRTVRRLRPSQPAASAAVLLAALVGCGTWTHPAKPPSALAADRMGCEQWAGGLYPVALVQRQVTPARQEPPRTSCTTRDAHTTFTTTPGGAHQHYGVTPDLATLAKAIANGFPVATLEAIADGSVHRTIAAHGERLMAGIDARLRAAGLPAVVTGFPQVFHVAFGLEAPARDWRGLQCADRPRYLRFVHDLLARRVRALERSAWFLSRAHDDAIVDETLRAVEAAAERVARAG